MDNNGYPFVKLAQYKNREIKAYSLIQLVDVKEKLFDSPIPVLLFRDNNNVPVIVNILFDKIVPEQGKINNKAEIELKNGNRSTKQVINLEASDEINLRCGKSEIVLRKNGKIIIKGIEVVNRAANKNKIRGASVLIN